jgi:type I restriction enzyme, S subunit
MESKNGYKLTEVGVIPDDWDATTIRGIASSKRNAIVGGPFGSDLVSTDYVNSGVPVIRGQNMHSRCISGPFVFVTTAKAKALEANLARPGDLIFTQRGTLGQVSVVPDEPFSIYLVSQSQMKVSLDREKADPSFYYYLLTSDKHLDLIRANTIQTSIPHLNLGILKKIPVQRPKLCEQHRIVEALSDADALLDSLDRLITKKRDLKQAAMQQLLTGETRLAGFDCEWKEKPLGELFAFSGGYSASRDQLSTEGHCYLHYGDIHGSTKVTVDASADYEIIPKLEVSLSQVGSKSMLENGDVVFVDASEDHEGASRHVVIVNTEKLPFISGLHTIVAKSKTEELTHEYRRYCFQTTGIRRQFLFYAVGTKVTGISKTSIGRIKLAFPCAREQTAIAEVLIDMDEELMVLETRRKKTRDLKQAMMQELLTGKTRLT